MKRLQGLKIGAILNASGGVVGGFALGARRERGAKTRQLKAKQRRKHGDYQQRAVKLSSHWRARVFIRDANERPLAGLWKPVGGWGNRKGQSLRFGVKWVRICGRQPDSGVWWSPVPELREQLHQPKSRLRD